MVEERKNGAQVYLYSPENDKYVISVQDDKITVNYGAKSFTYAVSEIAKCRIEYGINYVRMAADAVITIGAGLAMLSGGWLFWAGIPLAACGVFFGYRDLVSDPYVLIEEIGGSRWKFRFPPRLVSSIQDFLDAHSVRV